MSIRKIAHMWTDEQKRAIEIMLESGAEEAVRACDAEEAIRGLYSDPDEILAYGGRWSTKECGWWFAGYAGEIVHAHEVDQL
jgi:hypothetical protein